MRPQSPASLSHYALALLINGVEIWRHNLTQAPRQCHWVLKKNANKYKMQERPELPRGWPKEETCSSPYKIWMCVAGTVVMKKALRGQSSQSANKPPNELPGTCAQGYS